MKKLTYEDKIRVMNPCSEDWDEMIGNEHFRFCSHCAKNVNNISTMTRKEAMRLVLRSNGNLCIRYHIDPKTNSPIFLDKLHKITRGNTTLAAGAMATTLALSTAGYAQTEPSPVPQETMQTVVKTDTVKFEGGGFEPKEIKNISIFAGNLRRDVQMALQNVVESVEVSATPKLERYSSCAGDCVFVEPQSPLVQAVMNDDLEEVKARVIMRAKVNVRDKAYEGISPLHAAVENGNIEIIQFLLDSGAKTNIRDFQKRTPLMMMGGDATPEMFDLLLRYGAKVQLVDKEKNTVLHSFVGNSDNAEMVRLLISHGIDPNAFNKSGETALMIAAENGQTEDVKALLESGADVSKVNYERKTAWDVADSDEIRTLLVSYGAVARTEQ